MNSSTDDSISYKAPKPATAIASHLVREDKAGEYFAAQTAITNAARKFPGFVGTEVLCPIPGLQAEWVAIFRLESNDTMKRWLESPERAGLAARIEACLSEPSHLLLLASDDHTEPPGAMVFTHRVAREKVEDYLAWRRRAIAAQAHYPGYLATEFYEPHDQRDEWVDIVRYDSTADLTRWMHSKSAARCSRNSIRSWRAGTRIE
jgi:antibiotic biosynthesis monooxygenase (ABM) superfamily enzyme